jgi:HK97 gp10 family phage protein
MPYTSRIPQVVSELAVAVDNALLEGAEQVKEDAETRLAPHRKSGELERQLHIDDRKKAGIYVIAGDPKDPTFAFWGMLLEHGTSHSAPYPFLIPALEENRDRIVAAATAAVRAL